jgi:hypothetical protein
MADLEPVTESSSQLHQEYKVHRLSGLPPEAFYIPDFITEHEEEYLLKKVRFWPCPSTSNSDIDRNVSRSTTLLNQG